MASAHQQRTNLIVPSLSSVARSTANLTPNTIFCFYKVTLINHLGNFERWLTSLRNFSLCVNQLETSNGQLRHAATQPSRRLSKTMMPLTNKSSLHCSL